MLERLKWRKLDNSAKVFPIISKRKYANVFRISALLKENINSNMLKIAVEFALEKFPAFRVRTRHGFFWYYLEQNLKEVFVYEENTYPCSYIDTKLNNGYLFKVTYFNNKINLDIFHALTDGNTAVKFLKEIVCIYIKITHGDKFEYLLDDKDKSKDKPFTIEDSYIKNYNKYNNKNKKGKYAYRLTGNLLPLYAIGVEHFTINLQELKKISKKNNTTLTQYITAVIIYSIYLSDVNIIHSKRPITIFIPVNLKNYYESNTISNFFSRISVSQYVDKNEKLSFDEILKNVKNTFENKLKEDEVEKVMSSDVKFGNNFFIRIIPLFLKKFALKLGYLEVEKYNTTTFSNIGKIEVADIYKNYIDEFLFLLAPGRVEKIKFSMCSYDQNLVITITSNLNNNKIGKNFLSLLEKYGISAKIETNGVYDK